MASYRYLASGAALMALAMIAGPAAAQAQYGGQVSGTVRDINGVQSPFTLGSPTPSATQVRIGQTTLNYQVGANATAAHGGTSETNIQLAPFDPTVGNAISLDANSVVLYRITLGGSASDPFVPVDIRAQGLLSWTQSGDARAIFEFTDERTIGGAPQILIDVDIDKFTTPGKDPVEGNDQFRVDKILNLNPGDTYDVKVFTEVSAGVFNFTVPHQFGEDSAVSDPTFTVVGDFASRWSILGVPVDDTPGGGGDGVPEPAEWTMLIAGFGVAGSVLRRRRALTA